MEPHAAPRSPSPSRDVSPNQLDLVPGKLPLDSALDALAEHLVDLWLRRRDARRQKLTAPPPASEAAVEAPACRGNPAMPEVQETGRRGATNAPPALTTGNLLARSSHGCTPA